MNCEACGQAEASVQFTEVVGAQKRQRRLCSSCAQAEGLFINVSTKIAFSGEGADPPAEQLPRLRCSSCGCSLSVLRRTGRVGCPDCYDAFWAQIVPLLIRVHGTTHHFGLPGRAPAGDRRRELESEFEAALQEGDYLRAARLRDTLRALPPRAGEGST